MLVSNETKSLSDRSYWLPFLFRWKIMYKKLKIGEKLQNIDVCHKTVCWNTMYIEIMCAIILVYQNQILFKYLYILQLVCWNISVTNYCILKYSYTIQMCIFCPTSPLTNPNWALFRSTQLIINTLESQILHLKSIYDSFIPYFANKCQLAVANHLVKR